MSYIYTIDQGSWKSGEKKSEDLIKETIAKQKLAIPTEKQIECPKCKTLNPLNSVLCVSCGENMLVVKQAKIKDYSVIHKAHKRRKH